MFTNVYKFLDSNLEEDPNGLLYCVLYDGDSIRGYELMNIQKTETARIDNDTVEDISYTFDLELGEYVEQGREVREDTLPPKQPTDAEKIASLEAENESLKGRVSFTEDAILTLMDLNMML